MSDAEDPPPSAPDTTINLPNPTLYLSNIDWSVRKPLLRRAIYTMLSPYGRILEIVALRRPGLQGQAFVIFESERGATEAKNRRDGFLFFGKNLKIDYAREKSDRISKRDGTFVPKDRRHLKDLLEKKSAGAAPPPPPPDAVGEAPHPPPEASPPDAKRLRTDAPVPEGFGTVAPPGLPPPPSAVVPPGLPPPPTAPSAAPSKILFAQDLPPECTEMMLAMLFRQYSGYLEVRIPRPGLAFVEFSDAASAAVAMGGLDGFRLTKTDALRLQYGKV